MSVRPLTIVFGLGLTLSLGCDRGHDPAASGAVAPDAAPDGAAEFDAAADGVSPGEGGALSIIATPPASDDPRLAGLAEVDQGGDPNGWDLCQVGPLSFAPASCASTCPAPFAGSRYLRFDSAAPVVGDPIDASQAYAYFMPALTTNVAQGLWFDLILLSGEPADATLTIRSTDRGCHTRDLLGTYDLSAVLAGPQAWRATCLNLTPPEDADALGFQFAGTHVAVGFDAPRFGPPCTAP